MNHTVHSSTMARPGGMAMLLATVLFAAVFGYLAARFDYPAVLERPADQVLPALLELGSEGRAVWLLYALVPLLLIPTAMSVRDVSRRETPGLGQAALWLGVLSAVAMFAGLVRWSTLQWSLAEAWPAASPETRALTAHRFAVANLYLGNIVGEFMGELFLNGFFLAAAVSLARVRAQRWLAIAGVAVSVLGWTAMLRNLTAAVAPVAALNNVVLPVWMLVLGLVMVWPASRSRS